MLAADIKKLWLRWASEAALSILCCGHVHTHTQMHACIHTFRQTDMKICRYIHAHTYVHTYSMYDHTDKTYSLVEQLVEVTVVEAL